MDEVLKEITRSYPFFLRNKNNHYVAYSYKIDDFVLDNISKLNHDFPNSYKRFIKYDYQFDNVYAIGDIHADYNILIEILKKNKIITNELNWNPLLKNTGVIQIGDFLHGYGKKIYPTTYQFFTPEEFKIIKLFTHLKNTECNGNKLFILVGNHEFMNVIEKYNTGKVYSACELYDLLVNRQYEEEIINKFIIEYCDIVIVVNNLCYSHAGITFQMIQKIFGLLRFPKECICNLTDVEKFKLINLVCISYVYYIYNRIKTNPIYIEKYNQIRSNAIMLCKSIMYSKLTLQLDDSLKPMQIIANYDTDDEPKITTVSTENNMYIDIKNETNKPISNKLVSNISMHHLYKLYSKLQNKINNMNIVYDNMIKKQHNLNIIYSEMKRSFDKSQLAFNKLTHTLKHLNISGHKNSKSLISKQDKQVLDNIIESNITSNITSNISIQTAELDNKVSCLRKRKRHKKKSCAHEETTTINDDSFNLISENNVCQKQLDDNGFNDEIFKYDSNLFFDDKQILINTNINDIDSDKLINCNNISHKKLKIIRPSQTNSNIINKNNTSKNDIISDNISDTVIGHNESNPELNTVINIDSDNNLYDISDINLDSINNSKNNLIINSNSEQIFEQNSKIIQYDIEPIARYNNIRQINKLYASVGNKKIKDIFHKNNDSSLFDDILYTIIIYLILLPIYYVIYYKFTVYYQFYNILKNCIVETYKISVKYIICKFNNMKQLINNKITNLLIYYIYEYDSNNIAKNKIILNNNVSNDIVNKYNIITSITFNNKSFQINENNDIDMHYIINTNSALRNELFNEYFNLQSNIKRIDKKTYSDIQSIFRTAINDLYSYNYIFKDFDSNDMRYIKLLFSPSKSKHSGLLRNYMFSLHSDKKDKNDIRQLSITWHELNKYITTFMTPNINNSIKGYVVGHNPQETILYYKIDDILFFNIDVRLSTGQNQYDVIDSIDFSKNIKFKKIKILHVTKQLIDIIDIESDTYKNINTDNLIFRPIPVDKISF